MSNHHQPSDPAGPWAPWFASEHVVQQCDGTSGHAVSPVAFCDKPERAAFIALACSLHDDFLAALIAAEVACGANASQEERAKALALVRAALNKTEAA